jgi:hypothetical protein
MRIHDRYSHRQALDKIKEKSGILSEIEEILEDHTLGFGKNRPREIRARVSIKFNRKGWADRVRVGNSKLTITFLKAKTGVCFQLGNVSRTYADIIKLAYLENKNVIDIGVIVVPDRVESRLMGTNYAQYDRLVNEIKQFADIIKVPILIIGLSN